MLDREAVLRKEHGSESVMFSGKKSKKDRHGQGIVDKDIEYYGCHKKGHKRSECPDRKKGKENSGKPTSAAASVASGNNAAEKNALWMAPVYKMSSQAQDTQRTMQDWYIDSACSQHVTGTVRE